MQNVSSVSSVSAGNQLRRPTGGVPLPALLPLSVPVPKAAATPQLLEPSSDAPAEGWHFPAPSNSPRTPSSDHFQEKAAIRHLLPVVRDRDRWSRLVRHPLRAQGASHPDWGRAVLKSARYLYLSLSSFLRFFIALISIHCPRVALSRPTGRTALDRRGAPRSLDRPRQYRDTAAGGHL
jgi:hypothetical protein